jgi:tetratricopeptide (TPR) repeat protein
MAHFLSVSKNIFSSAKDRTVKIILFLAVLYLFSVTDIYATSYPTLIVLPPVNKTGIASLAWLSIGIQDTMTVDLWAVSGVRTQALTEYGSLKNYNIGLISSLDSTAAIDLAKEAKADLVWRGEYSFTNKNSIKLVYSALDSKDGNVLAKQEITGTLNEIPSMISQMTVAMLSGSAIRTTELEAGRISKPKTASIDAFKENALGYGIQLQQYVKVGHTMTGRIAWVEHCSEAVKLDPQYAEAYVNLGWALYSDKKREAALSAFLAAVKLKPYLLDGWMGIGYIQRDNEAISLAIDAFKKAEAINALLEWPREELQKLITITTPVEIKKEAQVRPENAPSFQAFQNSLTAEEKQLLTLSKHESLEIRMSAIKSLSRSKGSQSMPFLIQMLGKRDQAFEVLKIMVDISVPESAPYLIEALEKHIVPDGSRLSGLTEQNILGVIQLVRRRSYLSQVTPALIKVLADSSAAIRESAALTLGDLGKKESVAPLKKLLETEQYALARMSALVSLVKLGDEDSRMILKKIISEGRDMAAINYATKLMKQRQISIIDK